MDAEPEPCIEFAVFRIVPLARPPLDQLILTRLRLELLRFTILAAVLLSSTFEKQ